MGLPTPNIFTGGNNFHSKYEWIALEDMQKTSETLVHLLSFGPNKECIGSQRIFFCKKR